MDIYHIVFIHSRSREWFLSFGCCAQCCCEHLCTSVCVDVCFCFSWVSAQNRIVGHMVSVCFNLLRNCQDCFPKQLYHFKFLPAVYEGSSCIMSLSILVIICLSDDSHPCVCEVVSRCDFSRSYLSCQMLHLKEVKGSYFRTIQTSYRHTIFDLGIKS